MSLIEHVLTQWLVDDIASCAANMTRTQLLMHGKIQQQQQDDDNDDNDSSFIYAHSLCTVQRRTAQALLHFTLEMAFRSIPVSMLTDTKRTNCNNKRKFH